MSMKNKFIAINLSKTTDGAIEGIQSILNKAYKVVDPASLKMTQSSVENKTFVLTGKMPKKRDSIKRDINRANGHIASSVTYATSYLVDSNNGVTTTKLQEARKRGIPIISYETLYEMLSNRSPQSDTSEINVTKDNLYILDLTKTLGDNTLKFIQFPGIESLYESSLDAFVISENRLTESAIENLYKTLINSYTEYKEIHGGIPYVL